jgi:DNA-binding NarL/FixJ family response regulator
MYPRGGDDTPILPSPEKRRAHGRRIVLLGGSHALTTEALAWMLSAGGHRVTGSYASLAELSAAPRVAHLAPEIVVADADDIALGPTAVSQIRASCPRAKILLLSEGVTPALVRCAIEAHVDGVVLKSDSAEEVMVALAHVSRGLTVMPAGWRQVDASHAPRTPLDSLGARPREILDLAARGLTNGEIAERLTISPNTVKFHLRSAYALLGVRNRVEAARIAGYSTTDRSPRRSEG